MKIKESNEKISLNKTGLIFFVSAIVSLILRIVQMNSFIDIETGFFTGGMAVNVIAFAIIVLSSAVIMVSSFISAETKKMDVYTGKNTALGVASALFAVSLIYDFGSSLSSSVLSAGTSTAGTPFQSLMLSGTLPLLLRSIFAFFSAVYFFMFSKGAFKGDNRFGKHKYLALAPVGWAGFRMIHRFVEQISFIRVSELFLELILLALMILFFMTFAQIASGIYVDSFRWRIMGIGLPAALLAVTINGARLVCALTSAAVNSDYAFCVSDFVFFIFVSVLVMSAVKQAGGQTETE